MRLTVTMCSHYLQLFGGTLVYVVFLQSPCFYKTDGIYHFLLYSRKVFINFVASNLNIDTTVVLQFSKKGHAKEPIRIKNLL